MASTTALLTGLTGLSASARSLEVIGNNVSNANTTAYKSSRLEFASALQRTIHSGSVPDETLGGTNPYQIGLGVLTAGTVRNLTQGSITSTGDERDLAIDGEGFFIIDRDGEQLYTRAGAFRPDANSDLVTLDGFKVQGYLADESFVIREGELTTINIPIGARTPPEATSNVRVAGLLDTDGDVPTVGSSLQVGGTTTTGLRLIAGATVPPTAPNVIESTSLVTEIEDPLLPGSGTPLFEAGRSIQIEGARRGGLTLATTTFQIEADTTVADLEDFFFRSLGIHDTGIANPDGNTPGVALDPLTGFVRIVGNTGEINDLEMQGDSIRLLNAEGDVVRLPFGVQSGTSADGESVRTTFNVYDSLGDTLDVSIAFVLESKSDVGTTWRYYIDSPAQSDGEQVATGTLRFGTAGRLETEEPVAISVLRSNAGASAPVTFDLAFMGEDGALTASAGERSEVAATFRDGLRSGVLETYSVGPDGTILGSFSNSQVKPLARLSLATFVNAGGLVDSGAGLFSMGANSGPPAISTPGRLGTGQIVSGSLEQSNVDLGQEFVRMILASTGYSAASRVVRTTDELLQQLLVLGR